MWGAEAYSGIQAVRLEYQRMSNTRETKQQIDGKSKQNRRKAVIVSEKFIQAVWKYIYVCMYIHDTFLQIYVDPCASAYMNIQIQKKTHTYTHKHAQMYNI